MHSTPVNPRTGETGIAAIQRWLMELRTKSEPMSYDAAGLASKIIFRTSAIMSMGLLPLAELTPTDVVMANGISTPAGLTSNVSIQWPSDGVVVGVAATTRDGLAASMAGTLLEVKVDGNEEFFPAASGNGQGSMSFAMISGFTFQSRFAIKAEFRQATAWTMTVTNTTAGTVVADVGFLIVRTSNLRFKSAP
jgi:hypothetical protein